MCQGMVNIQSPTAEIRRAKKKKERRNRMKIYMVSLLHRATIITAVTPFKVIEVTDFGTNRKSICDFLIRADHYIFILFLLLWSPYGIGRPYIFSSCFFFFFFSSPNLSSRRLDVYHTSAHGVVLV